MLKFSRDLSTSGVLRFSSYRGRLFVPTVVVLVLLLSLSVSTSTSRNDHMLYFVSAFSWSAIVSGSSYCHRGGKEHLFSCKKKFTSIHNSGASGTHSTTSRTTHRGALHHRSKINTHFRLKATQKPNEDLCDTNTSNSSSPWNGIEIPNPIPNVNANTLTKQERILEQVLGIEPETPQEKQARLKSRQDQIQYELQQRRNNIAVAILAFAAAILNYAYQYTHPVTSLSLLLSMQNHSADLSVIGKNGKPTVVDFWAPWCENCKASAPTLYAIEEEYKDRVNFVLVNGDVGENWPVIERFGVDAIPHLAMVSSEGEVETALIGPIPRRVLRADLDTMIANHEILERSQSALKEGDTKKGLDEDSKTTSTSRLPYVMYDAFRSRPDLRHVSF